MKICIVCPGWPGKVNRWNGIFILEQAVALRKQGCQIDVVTARVFKEDLPNETVAGINVSRFWFPSKQKLLTYYKRIPPVRILFYVLSGIIKTVRTVKSDKCDLIHAHFVIPAGLIGVLAGKLTNKPVVVTAHDSDVVMMPKRSKIAAYLLRYTLRKADLIVATTSELSQDIATNFNIPKEKIKVIALGVDRRLFKPMDQVKARKLLDLSQNRKFILFIGALVEAKGIKDLIDCLPDLIKAQKDLSLLVMGDGPLRDLLKNTVAEMELTEYVRFIGSISHEDVPIWLNACDVMVLPSWSEGLGMVVREAVSVGVPVVASAVGGIPDVIKDGQTGYLTKPGNIVQLSERIRAVLTDDGFRRRVEASKDIVDKYDHEVIASQIKDNYRNLVDNRTKS